MSWVFLKTSGFLNVLGLFERLGFFEKSWVFCYKTRVTAGKWLLCLSETYIKASKRSDPDGDQGQTRAQTEKPTEGFISSHHAPQ